MDTLIVVIILALAVGYIGHTFYRKYQDAKTMGAGCGCSGGCSDFPPQAIDSCEGHKGKPIS